jgi:hypothetical protein
VSLDESEEKGYAGFINLINTIFLKIRANRHISKLAIVAILENDANYASWMAEALKKYGIYTFSENRQCAGVRKGMNGEAYGNEFYSLMGSNKMAWCSALFTTSFKNADDAKKKLLNELLRYGYNSKGKLTAKYGNENDDMLISFLQGIFWTKRIYENKDYMKQITAAMSGMNAVVEMDNEALDYNAICDAKNDTQISNVPNYRFQGLFNNY